LAAHLLIIGEREGLAWVLEHQKMAFPPARVAGAKSALQVGDTLLLYTSRGCFHNPGRDRGRVIGRAVVTAPIRARLEPLILAERRFSHDCKIEIQRLARFRTGVELPPLVPSLEVFRGAASWPSRLRQALLTLPAHDAKLLERALTKVADSDLDDAIASYRAMMPQA
jgi:hypothetical protein